MASSSRRLLLLALLIGLLGVFWPQIEEAFFHSCPFLFNRNAADDVAPIVAAADLPVFTVATLGAFDGTDDAKPIYMAVGGKVLDVTSGERFYKKGNGYHQFAGKACTRALTIASLEAKDMSDDISDFTPEQLAELEKTLAFYHGKYPVVGTMDYAFEIPSTSDSDNSAASPAP
ncbi:hypothetical protein SDRG_08623 [Saprolegnia diclina VS20]|uniref:Cytochrome b5 heme-binding domain-containing protein n=1 Tax=Saprolegnia diclina (strain VS20) TaxID=1156394 RepID=T0RU61_SAPDV|nr:hypothetical protein SDRG_08623 [Saprolegnia diclina VS20]EQC33942.1 hypothetical protein SDRG_08623 [Saprolegnia diclina VS20]|eukprot:XP_008612737.1 hypothetical protein SDRG_08623 [Saprolegnia diclina VS20]